MRANLYALILYNCKKIKKPKEPGELRKDKGRGKKEATMVEIKTMIMLSGSSLPPVLSAEKKNLQMEDDPHFLFLTMNSA